MKGLKKLLNNILSCLLNYSLTTKNDPLLNKTFLEGLDEDLDSLLKRHNLGWSALHTNPLVTLADQLFKTIKKKEKGISMKIMNLQLCQLSTHGS